MLYCYQHSLFWSKSCKNSWILMLCKCHVVGLLFSAKRIFQIGEPGRIRPWSWKNEKKKTSAGHQCTTQCLNANPHDESPSRYPQNRTTAIVTNALQKLSLCGILNKLVWSPNFLWYPSVSWFMYEKYRHLSFVLEVKVADTCIFVSF